MTQKAGHEQVPLAIFAMHDRQQHRIVDRSTLSAAWLVSSRVTARALVQPGSSASTYQQTVIPVDSHARFLSLVYAVAAASMPGSCSHHVSTYVAVESAQGGKGWM